jgi:hypothetical protein
MYQLFQRFNGKLFHIENFGLKQDAINKAIFLKTDWSTSGRNDMVFEVHYFGMIAYSTK